MNFAYFLGLIAAIGVTLFVFELLRRGILQERYAILWLAVSLVVLVFAIFPGVLSEVSSLIGFAVPANLLFFLTGVLLLVVSVQLSFEISKVEARTRRLAEEVALLTAEVERLKHRN